MERRLIEFDFGPEIQGTVIEVIMRPLGRILRRTLSVRPSRYRCHG